MSYLQIITKTDTQTQKLSSASVGCYRSDEFQWKSQTRSAMVQLPFDMKCPAQRSWQHEYHPNNAFDHELPSDVVKCSQICKTLFCSLLNLKLNRYRAVKNILVMQYSPEYDENSQSRGEFLERITFKFRLFKNTQC